MKRTLLIAGAVLVLGLVAVLGLQVIVARETGRMGGAQGGGIARGNGLFGGPRTVSETVERTDYTAPPRPPADPLADDLLEDKHTAFDPDLVFPEARDGWLLNLSDAILRLDVPMIRADAEGELLTLHPSYAAAVKAAAGRPYGATVLPSVNMIDGKAKQFDDGLYAAIDLAYYQGVPGALKSHLDLFERLLARVGPDSPAAPFLAAGLSLAGREAAGVPTAAIEPYVRAFESNPVQSKPIGVYTWGPELGECFRVLRFFQRPFRGDLSVPRAVATALAGDPELRADYEAVLAFYARLTNPLKGLSFADLIDRDEPVPPTTPVALLPASVSRESELFERLFPLGPPAGVDMLMELVRRIRSGEVDLAPRADSGWYDHQVHALETMLLPERGAERDKLLLTRSYKARMLEAFKALMTKRRETHVRQLDIAKSPAAMVAPLKTVAPRLRLEPNPTYYLRTARAYGFLADVLDAGLGAGALDGLHGLRQGGRREPALRAELGQMRALFYGCHLLSCEDIGQEPALADGEADDVDRPAARKAAADWLATIADDPDMAADTRVAVPIFADLLRRKTRSWSTLGVRLARLDVGFVRPPRVRPESGEGDWAPVPPSDLAVAHYLIPVDEFAEFEMPRLDALTRDAFRALCDQGRTKEAILDLLQK